MVLSVSSATWYLGVFTVSHGLSLVMFVGSTVTGMFLYAVSSTLATIFTVTSFVSSTATFLVSHGLSLVLSLSSTVTFLQHYFAVFPGVSLIITVVQTVVGGAVASTEISEALAIACVAFIMAVTGIALAVSRREPSA